MKCFKIVRRSGDRLLSLIPHKFSVEYLPGVPMSAQIGQLFVYVNAEDALDNTPDTGEELWLCEAILPTRQRRRVLMPHHLSKQILEDYWGHNRLPLNWMCAPYGTFVTYCVTLIRCSYKEKDHRWIPCNI